MSEPVELKVKDYQIHLPAMGEGAYGSVYRATYRGLSDRALKVFRPGAVDIVAMARELEKLSSVAEHNGIVTLHDFDLLHEPPFYVMGLHADLNSEGKWESRTLEQLCGEVDYREGWRLIREIADAVSYLHRNQIVHCDLKPSNILLTDESPHKIKICDFGQSRGSTAEGFEPVGTPLYASPEQLRNPGDSAEGKGFRWDVYSFGVIAYKLLTGKLPRLQLLAEAETSSFDAETTVSEASVEATFAETGNQLDGATLASMIEAVEEIEWPPDLYVPTSRRLLIEQCLSLDPEARPSDMREVYNRIQRGDQLRVMRRSRRLNTVFALLLVVAVWASILAFFHARKAEKAREEALVSEGQAKQLALIIVDEFDRGELSGSAANQLYGIIADHAEAFLDNLPKNRGSETTLRFSAQTASMRGRQAFERGDLDEALAKYSNSYEIRSQLGGRSLSNLADRDLMQIGRIHEAKGNLEAASESYEKVRERRMAQLELSGDNVASQQIREAAEVHLALGQILQKLGEPDRAVGLLDDLSKIYAEASPDAPESLQRVYEQELMPILSRKGEVQFQSNDLKGAFETFAALRETASTVRSKIPSHRHEAHTHTLRAMHFLGQIQLSMDNTKEAELLFRDEIRLRQKAVQARPYDPDLKVGLAVAYQKVASCLKIEDATERSLGIYYLEEALSLLSRLPPDIRNDNVIEARAESFQSQLDAFLEIDE